MATKNVPATAKKQLPTTWEQQLATAAAQGAEAEAATGGSKMFSVKGGVLAFAGMPVKGNTMQCVVADSIFENAYYGESYDPDHPLPPICYSYSRDGKDMEPHAESPEKQHGDCTTCPHNQWGSAEKGKGKACKNTRRLLIIPATATEDPATVRKADYGFLKLPVTSTVGWANYVKALAASYKRPPFGVITEIGVVPDPKTQFKVTFNAVDPIKDPQVGAAIMELRDMRRTELEAPYPKKDADEKPAKKTGKRGKF